MKRAGLLGGTFDPVHNGHVALAKAALAQLGLNHIRWMPAGSPWQKQQQPASHLHRVAMLQLAVDVEAHHVIDERELHRAGPSYTVDTLEALALDFPSTQWHLIIGQDQLARLPTWHRWQEVVKRVALAVVARDGHMPHPDDDVLAAGANVRVVTMQPMAISSSGIRARLQQGQAIDDLVPEGVARYIDRHGLYR